MTDFRIRIIVDTSGVVKGAKQTENALKKTNAAANKLGQTLKRAFAVFAGVAAIRQVVRTLASFEQSISTVGAIAGASASQLQDFRDIAQELGATTRFSASQAAEGLEFLARAGFSVTESIEAVDDTLRLAQAGALDLGRAADITSNVLQGFGISVNEAGRVVDVLAAGAANANTNVEQLGQALSFTAPIAKGLGVSLEETTAAIGALSNAGLQASRAGTGLNRILAELESPAKATQEVLARFGISADEVRISSVGLTAALTRLRDAGVDAGAGLELFGQRGGPAFAVLKDAIPDIIELEKTLLNSSGAAQQIADVMDDNLNGALLQVASAFEALVLAIGDAGTTSALTTAMRALADVLRFLADNAGLVLAIITSLTIAIGANFVLSMVSATTATVTFTASIGAATVATKAFFTTLVATNPVLLGLVAVATAVTVAMSFLAEENEAVAETFRQLEKDAMFGQLGAQIRVARQEVSRLDRAIEAQQDRGVGPTQSQLDRLDMLKDAISGVRGEIKQEAVDRKQLDDARKGAIVTVDNLIASLNREAEALKSLGVESEVQAKVATAVEKLLLAGQAVSPAQREQIELLTRRNAGLRDQKRLLEEIEGPLAEIARREDALNALRLRGAITAEIFRAKLAEIRDEQDEIASVDPFQDILLSLREGNDLLIERAKNGELAAQQLAISQQLAAEGIALDGKQRESLERLLVANNMLTEAARQRTAQERLARKEAERVATQGERFDKRLAQFEEENRILEAQLGRRSDVAAALREEAKLGFALTESQQAQLQSGRDLNESLKAKVGILEELQGPEQQFLVTQRALKELLDSNIISQDQFNQKLREAKIAALEADQSISGGFSRGLLKIGAEIENVGALAESTLVNAFNNIESALVSFVQTGKLEFKDLANSILADIARLLIRLLILQAVQAATGTGGAVSTVVGAATRQGGGPVDSMRSFLVGEEGPELFTPQGSGNITPAAETAAMMAGGGGGQGGGTTVIEVAAPDVNVTVVNVRDENEMKDQLNSGDLDIPIVNVLSRKKGSANQALGR